MSSCGTAQSPAAARTLIDALLEEQRDLTAVERFARWHDAASHPAAAQHRALIPLNQPRPGEQYAFEVDLDRCSGCKSCVTACHALNGLDEAETWRSTGLLHGAGPSSFQQTITTACHHCVEPGCLEGCPVLAYDKEPLTGIVRHLDDQCIGCQYCIFMCPYEVPQFSASRGIVRKCDMCQQRLTHREAPACAQACPNEAIRIKVVDQASLREEYRGDTASLDGNGGSKFLPCSPEPAITVPSTRYVSAQPLAPELVAGDWQEIRPAPAHAPLVVMLILTQLGAGGFALLPAANESSRPALAMTACLATLLGVGASVLHLGKPAKAWRAFLGLRRSWLSREIIAFIVFALLASALSGGLCFAAGWTKLLLWPTAMAGLAGVLCSGMTYHVTRRECWHGELSLGRFFGSTCILGSAAAWAAEASAGSAATGFAMLAVANTVSKLALELRQLRFCPDDAGLNDELPGTMRARSAFLMRFRLGGWLRARLTCAWVGGVILPCLSLLLDAPAPLLAWVVLVVCLAGESLERLLFFRAAAVWKMPGVAHR